MLKRDITYEDFDGKTVTEPFYFNLTRTEIVELEVSVDGGLEAAIRGIVSAGDNKSLIEQFKRIVLLSYGVRSEDGKRFIKSEEAQKEFSQTAAYDALFMDLATNENSAADFIKGVIPDSLAAEIDKADIVNLPPQPPQLNKE